jgi:ribosomal protein L32
VKRLHVYSSEAANYELDKECEHENRAHDVIVKCMNGRIYVQTNHIKMMCHMLLTL